MKDTLVVGFPSAEQMVHNPIELVSRGGDCLGFAEFPSDALSLRSFTSCLANASCTLHSTNLVMAPRTNSGSPTIHPEAGPDAGRGS